MNNTELDVCFRENTSYCFRKTR